MTKTVHSLVPSEVFLPEEVRPLKARLDLASGGRDGSPHQVLVVNGEVYEHWFGARSVVQIETAVSAILNNTAYPYKRCVRRTGQKDRRCAIRGESNAPKKGARPREGRFASQKCGNKGLGV